MKTILASRVALIEQLQKQHSAGKIKWEKSSDEESIQARIGDFAFHVDKKNEMTGETFKIWIFKTGDFLDAFSLPELRDGGLDLLQLGKLQEFLSNMYIEVVEKDSVDSLTLAIDALKNLGGE